MGVLIDTLYQYTKADERVPFESTEMDQVMRDTLSNLEHLIRERGARVTYDSLPAVAGNASQLTQLLQNLIGNAVKYCEAKTPSVHIGVGLREENRRSFFVKDNGIGISREYYRQIFEPFKRLHGSGAYEGTGLGLATCKKIVERHDGRIWCESEQGRGSTFFFTLRTTPLQDSQAASWSACAKNR
jgi:light-regulated signal transduction histidine kinase (bacteriophytochrome)